MSTYQNSFFDKFEIFEIKAGVTGIRSEEELKNRLELRAVLVQELDYLRLVSPIDLKKLTELDRLVLQFPLMIRSFDRQPFGLGMLDRALEYYLADQDRLEDLDIAYALSSLYQPRANKDAEKSTSEPTVEDFVLDSCAAFAVGYLLGKALYARLTRDHVVANTKSQPSSLPVFLVQLSEVFEVLKRAVVREDYRQIVTLYGPALRRTLEDDAEAKRDLILLVKRLMATHFSKTSLSSMPRVVVVGFLVFLAITSIGAAIAIKGCSDDENDDENDDDEDGGIDGGS